MIALLCLLDWPADTARAAVEHVCGALTKAGTRQSAYETLRRDGTQKAAVPTMQTRAELYDFLGYHEYEQKLDQLFAQGKK